MTQAQTQDGNGQVLAAAALGLALIQIEQQVRDDVHTTVDALYRGLAAAAVLAASTAPATLLTGLALISLGHFHDTTTALYNTARLKVRTAISTGYAAASRLAYAHTKTELGPDSPDGIPELGDTLNTLLRDVDLMFGHAQTDFQNLVTVRFDPADRSAVGDDILNADGALSLRSQAAAGAAVHKGANDTLQAVYAQYQMDTGQPGLMKRWRTTSNKPCGMCRALNGTLVGVNAEFDHTATTNDKDFRNVWRNLDGPPRHPNCRCRLELVRT